MECIVIFFSKLIIFVILSQGYCSAIDDEYPNIQDLFKIPTIDSGLTLSTQPNMAAKVTIDIEKIDVDKLRKKLEQYPPSEISRQWKATWNFYRSYNATGNETVPLNETRRYKILHPSGWWSPWAKHDARWEYERATEYASCAKLMDLCLQTIYMARHKLTQLQQSRYFNRKDIAYRIAYVYKNLRRLYRKLVDIYLTSARNHKYLYYESWRQPDFMIWYHTRFVRIYIDFLYWYWVLIELHKEHREKSGWTLPTGPDVEWYDMRSTTPASNSRSIYFKNLLQRQEWLIFGRK